MTTGGSAELVRRPEGSTRATLLELLFDVIFVAALALVSMLIADRQSWAGIGQILLLLMAIWWTWAITSTTTDFYDPEQRPIQTILMVTMLGAVATAAALPLASDGHALIFAVAYVVPHLFRGVVLVGVLRRQRHRAQERATRFFFWFLVSAIFWIVGALPPGQPHWPLWVAAVVIDYVSGAARYPTPWLGRVPVGQYEKTTEHLGERYQQFMILALGDIILVPTLEISTADFSSARLGAFLAAFLTMLLLWQVYVYRAGAILQTSSTKILGRAARLGPYTHLVMLIGVVCTAAGYDLVVSRPTGQTPVRWIVLIVGGPVVFLLGRTLFAYLVTGSLPWHRALWLVPLAVAVPFARGWAPVVVTLLTLAVLAGLVFGDMLGRHQKRPPFLRGRPG
ncbi:low temperature requirement protein A [Micromonospora sp. WMMD812]|uniref:low temperature requirement protein A n=1 Tax=Micromonospora sp. WMMD812 TaxID=3015152 RepID=UPI00248C101D|nr:low temperature requirement protein A [Micromonospora sp. WMMD812]WBB68744.1 low temperature requirement protein A [Micromonospora sp. WMMD812]